MAIELDCDLINSVSQCITPSLFLSFCFSLLEEGKTQLNVADFAPPKEKVLPIPEGSAFFCLSKTNP